MACNISNLASHTCIASIDLTNFYKRHSVGLSPLVVNNMEYAAIYYIILTWYYYQIKPIMYHAIITPLINICVYCRYSIDNPKYTYFHTMPAEDSAEFIQHASHSLIHTFVSCKIFGRIEQCADVIDVVPTDAGIYIISKY